MRTNWLCLRGGIGIEIQGVTLRTVARLGDQDTSTLFEVNPSHPIPLRSHYQYRLLEQVWIQQTLFLNESALYFVLYAHFILAFLPRCHLLREAAVPLPRVLCILVMVGAGEW